MKKMVELHDSVHTSLYQAALLGNINEVKNLIGSGVCVNFKTFDGNTALHGASFGGNMVIIELLIENGAIVNALNYENLTPLWSATAGGQLKVVSYLLNVGAWVNPPLSFTSPIHEAGFQGHGDIAKILIDAGAPLESSDINLGTPLFASCMGAKSFDCIKVVLNAGAEVNSIKNHMTPLHKVAETSTSIELVELLLSFGANVYMEDGKYRRPSGLCKDNKQMLKLLQFYEQNASRLTILCRLAIRKHMGRQSLESIPCLPIPEPLKRFLLYKDY